MNLKEHVPLAPLTTFGVGGSARFFVEAESAEEVVEALAFAHERALPVFALGGGSNVVISDSGFDGLVIAMRVKGIMTKKEDGHVLITVGAGEVWDRFVTHSIENKLYGLEYMSGVPGTVGGAVVANVGAYGAQISDTFVSAEVIDTTDPSDKIQTIREEECDFSYHSSMFGRMPCRYIIISSTFLLSTDSSTTPSYRDNRFDMATIKSKLGHRPNQNEIRDAVLNMREEKGSLIMAGRKSFKCAGSFFHMPFVSASQYEEITKIARKLDEKKEKSLRPWAWKQSDGSYKIAPGFLLEYSEFQKGYIRGGAGISPLHTLSIINVGNARASEVAELARDMQNAVKKIFGIELEREVKYIGDVEK